MKPGQFIDALHMRTNAYETRVAINRAMKTAKIRFRRCPATRETLSHILGQCLAGYRARHERRYHIVGKLDEELQAQGVVTA